MGMIQLILAKRIVNIFPIYSISGFEPNILKPMFFNCLVLKNLGRVCGTGSIEC